MKRSPAGHKKQHGEHETMQNEFARDVLHGLSQPRKSLPCKYIYDDAGSKLFSRITTLPEYYPTRCETEILEAHGGLIAGAIGTGRTNIVELGAGDGAKTRLLIPRLMETCSALTYVPLDISDAAVRRCSQNLCRLFPDLRVRAMTSDYFDGLKWLAGQNQSTNLVLFLGSTIGNFAPKARNRFLVKLRRSVNPGDMVLIGFDLVKDVDVMTRAYNDCQGVTARFNKNILVRINRELGGDFDPDGFRYFSIWDVPSRGMHSYLVSRRPRKVRVEAIDETFAFKAGETIHTESSYKFTLPQIRKMAADSGFVIADKYLDSEHWFADCLWRAV